MYPLFLNWAQDRLRYALMTPGCGTFMITSRSSGRTLLVAKVHANPAPQSWPMSVTLFAPLASSSAATSSIRRSTQ